MIVEATAFRGVHFLRGVRHRDPRGSLRKVLVAGAARDAGLDVSFDEVVVTTNDLAGTVRGMHFQVPPHAETKTLWVTAGALFDVLVDMRPEEPTYGSWLGVDLTADDDLALQVPPGVAHGYQTLVAGTTITYLIRGSHSPEHARTLRWDDLTVAITWPHEVSQISDKDREGSSWPVES